MTYKNYGFFEQFFKDTNAYCLILLLNYFEFPF